MAEGEKFQGYQQAPYISLDDIGIMVRTSDTADSPEGSTRYYTHAQLIDFVNKYANKSVAGTYANITDLIADQANQQSGNIYLVTNAALDPEVSSGEAYYNYLGTTDEDLGDYNRLTSDEVTVVEAAYGWDQKVVKGKATSYGSYSNLAEGYLFLETDNTNITALIVDDVYTTALSKASTISPRQYFGLNIYNHTKKTNVRAVITAFTLVDSNTKMKLDVSGVLDADIDADDVLSLGLPIELSKTVEIGGFDFVTIANDNRFDVEVGNFFSGFSGDRYVVGKVLTVPLDLPTDLDDDTKIKLFIDNE